MAGIMAITKAYLARVAGLSPSSYIVFRVITAILCVYSVNSLAHDPGLSLVTIEQNSQQLTVHSVYARQELQLSTDLTADQATVIQQLEAYIDIAMSISDEGGKKKAQSTRIEIDQASSAVHFWQTFEAVEGTELMLQSHLLDQLPLGHRQFVKVSRQQKLITSRILSARDPHFKVNLPNPDLFSVFNNFILEGVWHIWIGLDHILFVMTLLLPSVLVLKQGHWLVERELYKVFKQTVKVISAFTIAHSLTLTLTVYQLITLPSNLVESMIALSVVVASVNNIFAWVDKRLWILAFVFGLLHGMGFATVLSQLGLPQNSQALALLGFNVGVELGQLAIIILLLPILYYFRTQKFYQPVVMKLGSGFIAVIGLFWFVQRLT